MKPTILVTTLLVTAVSSVAHAQERIATFDLGSLDTLDALGVSDQIVGIPKQILPDYLSTYNDDAYTDLGGLRSPDLEAIAESEPSLILYTGRQGEWESEFEEIAPVLNTSLQGDDYLVVFDDNVRQLASHVGVEERAEEALKELHADIESHRQALDEALRVLVVTSNDGNLGLNTHPVVHDVLGIKTLEMPDSVTSITRGSRTFTPLTMDAIGEIQPDVLLVVDRSAAIGNDAADTNALERALADAGTPDTRLVVLTPALWYLSGGGLQSLKLQIDEVVEAL
ncbi:Iron compound ABC uptake transporter substrate-binding protein [Halomonas citrativorans]|uniref:Iron compound ABC uptake transporter substrate-binding protein n=1 Tax=Halomonas citrativorans TaxID=2742612 RepID=A0A1R4I4G8_9GAMM|nr:ABC transporter substrate-binding protein [Halomonas citrativorans]SJN14700.1 Iron compound ABC uptake transporter substrate-binding protein [Halomonas citrativorans]